MAENAKKVGEIFSDYKTNSNIKYGYVDGLQVHKKTNTLGVTLETDEYIEVKEIWYLEKFLMERFGFGNVDTKIKYKENVEIKSIQEEWKNIICYMAHKYPLAKPMLLLNADIEVIDNKIDVKMHIKGAEFLRAKKSDKTLETLIKNLMGKEYKIEITEELNQAAIKKLEEENEKAQKSAVSKIMESLESARREQEASKEMAFEGEAANGADPNYVPPTDGDIPYMEGEGMAPEDYLPPEMPEFEQEQILILGKQTKAKENKVKIKEITPSDARITLEGRVSNVEKRLTKSEKVLLIFELFDGTGTITCKSFTVPDDAENVIAKLEESNTVKLIGKANLDAYAGDVTVIANTIYQTNNDSIPKKEDVEEEETPVILGFNQNIGDKITKITDLGVEEEKVVLKGEVLNMEPKELKSGKTLLSFDLYDGTSTLTCKAFLNKDQAKKVPKRMKKAKGIMIEGNAGMDKFSGEISVMANTIIETEGLKKETRMDNAPVKRVELHMHTKMSQMDAMTSAQDLIKRAMKWGMKSIAITDHGVVQSFPEAHHLLGVDNPDMKVLYGVEAYLAPDNTQIVYNSKNQNINTTYCVLDLETTGFSAKTEKITEVGIMKYQNGEVIDEFSCFVNPEKHIPQRVSEVTNITDDMVKDAETIDKVFPKILEFLGNEKETVVVAHNANFDVGFLKQNAINLGLTFDYTYLDTLSLAKDLFPDYKSYKLGRIADKLGIKVEVAHRALDDVDTTVKVFKVMMEMLDERGVKTIDDVDLLAADEEAKKEAYKKLKTYHAIILAKNYVGLRNLYKLVSLSHLHYFYKKPRILKSLYKKYSEGLILGSACEAGELYQAIETGATDDEIEAIANDYDYLEIQPIGNNNFLIRNGIVQDEEALRDINRKIVEVGDKLGKPVCATCDVHFMDPQDEIYRRILEAGQKYDDADNQAPLYLRTTEEMLEEFKYLGEEKAYEVVVTNTNKIADMCEQISPISPEKCPPHIPGCEEDIKNIAYKKAYEMYGNPLPEIVETRLAKELDSIISNGYSVMYIIAQKLVWKSNEDGYIVGSRGSVGSSLAAFMTGITEVNSLQPHYRCKKCKYSDFTDYGYQNGFDLPDKQCPNCGEMLVKDGMDIPFETFLGFNGDKEPDIDLNFSGEYQAKAHKYTEVIFGKGTTFKAGTVGTVADKTAYGYVKNYYEERGIPINKAEIARLSQGCTGIKRTTGQHPGGIIVVPKGREIYEFTPVQHPADDPNSDIITTHFDYHSIDANLLKLDILGHDDPTVIRMLQDLTGIAPTEIPLDDKETMSIFNSTDALGVTPEQIHSEVGTYGIPEYGTKFARGMLLDTKPTTFDELIRLSGLSHGTDVWLGNAQTLIEQGVVTLQEAICCRDDIMIYLIKKGVPPDKAFKIMETVRKGKALKDPEKWASFKEIMKEHDVPDWYVKSCEKIKYMFPKAHAAAYVTNAFRIAWFKVHIPLAYYAAYYSIRAKAFDAEFMINGKEKVKNKMKEIEIKNQKKEATNAELDMYDDLEIVLEMYERGLEFLPVDIYESDATKFKIQDNKLRPPLNSIAGFGTVAAQGIVNARKDGTFMSIDELKIRAKIGDSGAELLKKFGCLEGMSQSNQMSLFD